MVLNITGVKGTVRLTRVSCALPFYSILFSSGWRTVGWMRKLKGTPNGTPYTYVVTTLYILVYISYMSFYSIQLFHYLYISFVMIIYDSHYYIDVHISSAPTLTSSSSSSSSCQIYLKINVCTRAECK